MIKSIEGMALELNEKRGVFLILTYLRDKVDPRILLAAMRVFGLTSQQPEAVTLTELTEEEYNGRDFANSGTATEEGESLDSRNKEQSSPSRNS